jgi:hypothetical protein
MMIAMTWRVFHPVALSYWTRSATWCRLVVRLENTRPSIVTPTSLVTVALVGCMRALPATEARALPAIVALSCAGALGRRVP